MNNPATEPAKQGKMGPPWHYSLGNTSSRQAIQQAEGRESTEKLTLLSEVGTGPEVDGVDTINRVSAKKSHRLSYALGKRCQEIP